MNHKHPEKNRPPGPASLHSFCRIFAGMETNRQKKIARLIQKDLGEILQLEGRDWFPGVMVTVTKVNVTSDLSIARVYLSIFGKKAEDILRLVDMQGREIRRQLGLRARNQLRHIPELRFFIDDSLDYIDNIERLLKE
jgi:ribosome-binding factor A